MNDELKRLQSSFMQTLLKNNDAIVKHIAKQGNISNKVRANIYTNAYRVRLKEVIETDHEILSLYLGDELFGLLVKEYIQKHPSSYRSLRQFCDRLPNFLAKNKPFSDHSEITELASFERLLLTAFDSADATPIIFDDLLALEHEQWPLLKFRFVPSLQLFKSTHNAVQIWQAIKEKSTPPSQKNTSIQYWILWRNQDRVTEFKSLEIAEYAFIESFLQGMNFSSACEILLEYFSEEKVSQMAIGYLQNLFQHQLISGFEL